MYVPFANSCRAKDQVLGGDQAENRKNGRVKRDVDPTFITQPNGNDDPLTRPYDTTEFFDKSVRHRC